MLDGMGPGILEGLADRELVCIDDVDRVAGDDPWEVALFNLFNELHDSGGQLVVAACRDERPGAARLTAPACGRGRHSAHASSGSSKWTDTASTLGRVPSPSSCGSSRTRAWTSTVRFSNMSACCHGSRMLYCM